MKKSGPPIFVPPSKYSQDQSFGPPGTKIFDPLEIFVPPSRFYFKGNGVQKFQLKNLTPLTNYYICLPY